MNNSSILAFAAKRILLLACMLCTLSSFSQDVSAKPDQVPAVFGAHYNAGRADSIWQMFSETMKNALPAAQMPVLLSQLKAQAGNVLSWEYLTEQQGVKVYKGKVEKPGLMLLLSIGADSKIAGLFIRPDDQQNKSQPDTVESNDNVSVNVRGGKLYGTLTVPEGKTGIPVVLFIAGSGPTDRDCNSTAGLRTDAFLMLARSLEDAGIASLRYDKRGVGKSSVSVAEADTRFQDMVADARAFVQLLRVDNRFTKVIILGHSEGSLVGMIAAAGAGAGAFISVAGAGFSADKILRRQLAGIPGMSQNEFLFIDSMVAGKTVKTQHMSPGLTAIFRESVQPYLISWMQYDPAVEIKKLKVPVLIVQGTTDLQVTPDDADALKKACPKAGLELIEGMNHVLKSAPADRQQNIATYSNPSLPLHPGLSSVMRNFIASLK